MSTRSVLALVDHVTDISVIAQLFLYGHAVQGAVGIALDLLCGLVTVAHFIWLGSGWRKSLALLFHPVNFYLHSFYSLFKKLGEEEFSPQVARYSAAVQGLLEAPFQMVFTLSLVCIGYE